MPDSISIHYFLVLGSAKKREVARVTQVLTAAKLPPKQATNQINSADGKSYLMILINLINYFDFVQFSSQTLSLGSVLEHKSGNSLTFNLDKKCLQKSRPNKEMSVTRSRNQPIWS